MANMSYEKLVETSFSVLNRTYVAHYGLIITGTLAVVTNCIIFWLARKVPALRQGAYILVTQLAVADFLVGSSFAVTGAKRLFRIHSRIPEVATQLHCVGEMWLLYFGQAASITFALMMAIERVFVSMFPLRYKVNQRRIYPILSSVGWGWALIDSFFMFYGISGTKLIANCYLVSSVTQGFYRFQSYHKLSQVIAISLLYLIMIISLWRKMRKAKNEKKNMARVKKDLQIRVARMLATVGLLYLLTQIITRAGLAALGAMAPHIRPRYGVFIRMIIILNSGANLFIYVGLCKDYRKHFRAIILKKEDASTISQIPLTGGTGSTMSRRKFPRSNQVAASSAPPTPATGRAIDQYGKDKTPVTVRATDRLSRHKNAACPFTPETERRIEEISKAESSD